MAPNINVLQLYFTLHLARQAASFDDKVLNETLSKQERDQFLFNIGDLTTNIWVTVGVIAGGLLAMGLIAWSCYIVWSKQKFAQQDSLCWCLFCCPEIEPPQESSRKKHQRRQIVPGQQPHQFERYQ